MQGGTVLGYTLICHMHYLFTKFALRQHQKVNTKVMKRPCNGCEIEPTAEDEEV